MRCSPVYGPTSFRSSNPLTPFFQPLSKHRSISNPRVRQVSRAYASYNPDIGYCQGMNFVVALLLLVSGAGGQLSGEGGVHGG